MKVINIKDCQGEFSSTYTLHMHKADNGDFCFITNDYYGGQSVYSSIKSFGEMVLSLDDEAISECGYDEAWARIESEFDKFLEC